MIIDAHHHFWRLDRGDYGWLTPNLTALHRDFGPLDLDGPMTEAGVAGGIVVQAAPTEVETRYLLDLAARTPKILGVVGWTDFEAPDCADAVAKLAADPRLLGFRPMLQDLAEDDYILGQGATRALRAVEAQGLTFDALVRPRHLPILLGLRERHPDLTIIVDHLAKPNIASDAWRPWADDLQRLAADGRTVCKLSGLLSEAGPEWSRDHLRRYVDLALEAFGCERLMWGSDWPVLLMAGAAYGEWLGMARDLLAQLSASEQAMVFGGTALKIYGVDDPGGEADR